MLPPEKKDALVNLVGESIAERLISTMKERDELALAARVGFKSIDAPSIDDVLSILSNWSVKGKGMAEDMKEEKAMDEEETMKADMESADMEETESMEEESGMEEEEDKDMSILSDDDIEAIAKAVVGMLGSSMKAMMEETMKAYMETDKTEKDNSAVMATLAKAQVEALDEVVKTVKEMTSRLEAIEAVAGTPYRPSQATNNVITKKELSTNPRDNVPANLDPKYHDAYKALMDMNFIK